MFNVVYLVRVGVLSSQAAWLADPARCPARFTTKRSWAKRFASATEAGEAARQVNAAYSTSVVRLGAGPGPSGGVLALVLALTTAALAVAEQLSR